MTLLILLWSKHNEYQNLCHSSALEATSCTTCTGGFFASFRQQEYKPQTSSDRLHWTCLLSTILPTLHFALYSPCNIFYFNYGSHHSHTETTRPRKGADMLHQDFKKWTAFTFILLMQMIQGGASNVNLKLHKTSIWNNTLKADFGNQHPTFS